MAKLLLHVCCAPCLLGCIDSLKNYNITLFYYNPNTHPSGEYLKRMFFVRKIAERYNLPLIIGNYDFHDFFERAKGLEREKENGKRCFECFGLRLGITAKIAKEKKFDYFATTLSASPFKDSVMINEIGGKLGKKFDVKFLAKKSSKDDSYRRSIELCKKFDVYRQNYCGCILSLNNNVASPKE
jgi:predicted adenine nucleotide alpha hydrolase (AANH) superfamily ATPase